MDHEHVINADTLTALTPAIIELSSLILSILAVRIMIGKMTIWKIIFITMVIVITIIVSLIYMARIGLKYNLKYKNDDTFRPTVKDKLMMLISGKESSYNLNRLLYDALKDNDIKLMQQILISPNFNPKIKVKTPIGYLDAIEMIFRKHSPSNREIIIHMMRDYRFNITLDDILCEMYHQQNTSHHLFALDILKLYIFFRTDKKEDIESSINNFHWIECSNKQEYQMIMNMLKNDYISAYTHIKNELGYNKNMNFMMKLIDQGDVEALKNYVNKKKSDAMIKRKQAPQEPQQTILSETPIQTNI